MVFVLKKLVAPFLFPLAFFLEVLVAGLILLWFTKKQKAGKVVVTVGVALLVILGCAPVADLLLRPLEYGHPSLLPDGTVPPSFPAVKWVVVLGSGHSSDPALSVTSQIATTALSRLAEAIRLHRLFKGSRLLLSGGVVFDPRPQAEVMAQVAEILGVAREDMALEVRSRDTKDQAVHVREIVGDDPIVLVTSASHMPRAMAMFRKQGIHAVAAPTGYWVKGRRAFHISRLVPSPEGLGKFELVFYSWLSRAWAKLRGQT